MRVPRSLGALVLAAILFACLVAVCGCASAPLRRAARINAELATGVLRVQQTVEAAYQDGAIPRETRDRCQGVFLRLAQSGIALNQAIRDSDQQTALRQVAAMLAGLDAVIDQGTLGVPEPWRTRVGLGLEAVRAALLTLTATLGGS